MGPSYQRVFSIEESRGNRLGVGSSLIDHRTRGPGGRSASLLRELRIGHYTYKRLHWTVTAGYDVRTNFTPLTLGRSHMSIARMDLNHGERDLATLFYSRGATVGTSVLFSTWTHNPPGDFTFDDSPVLLYGGRWQRNEGDFGRFGATFINQLMQFPATPRSDGLRGDLPYEMIGPKRIRVAVADDSPLEQRANGMVYGVHLALTGQREGEPVRLSERSRRPGLRCRPEPCDHRGPPKRRPAGSGRPRNRGLRIPGAFRPDCSLGAFCSRCRRRLPPLGGAVARFPGARSQRKRETGRAGLAGAVYAERARYPAAVQVVHRGG